MQNCVLPDHARDAANTQGVMAGGGIPTDEGEFVEGKGKEQRGRGRAGRVLETGGMLRGMSWSMGSCRAYRKVRVNFLFSSQVS